MLRRDFSCCRILVVGDVILDRYVDGSVNRISPEAPVPVLLRGAERMTLGGAANVAANLVSLRAQVNCVGVIGDDEMGMILARQLRTLAAPPGGLVVDSGRPTTCKTRLMSGFHQLFRIDAESNAPLNAEIEGRVIASARQVVNDVDVVILSDYNKGVCTDTVIRSVIEMAKQAGKPVVVDPKRRDFSVYRGATIIKPNRKELSDATQMPCQSNEEAAEAASVVIQQTGSAILLTRSEQGMSYFERGSDPIHVPTAVRDVFDVSGAGDTVAALTALGIAAKLSTTEVMRVANVAASIVVSKAGTASVSVSELDAALDAESHNSNIRKGSLVSLIEASEMRARWRQQGLRVGFTNGCFDILHPGHVTLLQRAADECDRLIVAVNSDVSVRRLKGPTRPVQDQSARAKVLGSISAVDIITMYDEDTPANVVEILKPDLIIKGADYTVSQVVGASTVINSGGRVVLVPLVEGHSTTSIIYRLNNQVNQIDY